MNSFLFKSFLFYFILISNALCAQSGNNLSNPIHPLDLLSDPISPSSYFAVSYSNPLGIKSLQNFQCRYRYSSKRSSIHAGFQSFGLKGYLQYRAELGYSLEIRENFQSGINLHSDFVPTESSGPFKAYPGSSLFLSIAGSDLLRLDVYINNWTGLWFSSAPWVGKPGVSLIARIKGNEKISVISGLNFSRGFTPILRTGLAIYANTTHMLIAGLQSGPAGFWFGYSLTMDNLSVLLTIQSGGIFGYEPSSSIKYLFN